MSASTLQPSAPEKPKRHSIRWATVGVILGSVVIGSVQGCDSGEAAPTSATTATVTATATPTAAASVIKASGAPSSAPAQESLAAAVDKAITDNSPSGLPTWAMPITKIEDVSSGTIRVYYQENLTDTEAKDVGRKIRTYTAVNAGTAGLGTIVIRDAQGIDHNVFK